MVRFILLALKKVSYLSTKWLGCMAVHVTVMSLIRKTHHNDGTRDKTPQQELDTTSKHLKKVSMGKYGVFGWLCVMKLDSVNNRFSHLSTYNTADLGQSRWSMEQCILMTIWQPSLPHTKLFIIELVRLYTRHCHRGNLSRSRVYAVWYSQAARKTTK